MVYENSIETLIVKNLPQFITKAVCNTKLPFLDLLMAMQLANQ